MTSRSITAAWRRRVVERTLPAALGRATRHLAERVAAAAPVETGALRASVHATHPTIRDGRITSAVVVGSDHALAVEYGTEDMAAEPFFHPAIRAALPRAISIVADSR